MAKADERKAAFVVLEDGSVFAGEHFGWPPPCPEQLSHDEDGASKLPVGEVVFNTGMAGYHEILTDPSYSGQIIVMTYPHIGNYGSDERWSEFGPDGKAGRQGEEEPWRRLKARALVVRSLYDGPIPSGRVSLHQYMESYRTTGITGVDTRALTLRIRSGGSPTGVIVRPAAGSDLTDEERRLCLAYLAGYPRMEGCDLVTCLGTSETVVVNTSGEPHICLVDCGVKANIVRELAALGCRVSVVPNSIGVDDLLALEPDGILFSNGPGDPAVLPHLVDLARGLIGRKPTFGICLGHQIISLALGATTFKMKFGHHGVNNPVRDEETGVILITSQNHGFSVEESALPPECSVWFRNANDRTVEGIAHRTLPVLTAQFHPEAAPGPRDSGWIFRRFLERV